jgi:hypothetical protein
MVVGFIMLAVVLGGGGYLYAKIATLEKEIEEEKRLRGKS